MHKSHSLTNLDSQRNFHKHLLYQKQDQLSSTSSYVEPQEEEGEEGGEEKPYNHRQESLPENPSPSIGEIFRRSQFLYGALDPYQHHHPPETPKKRSYFSSALSLEPAADHAGSREPAAESSRKTRPTPSKLRPGNLGGGEIVEVQGGHIVRSTGRKDRHSKVCTAKGTRDRRVRLAAHTAIQFYDVQDRLGYDRPSKAVDWLIKKAQAAIDELAQLPPWHPSDLPGQNPSFRQEDAAEQSQQHLGINSDLMIANTNNCNNPTAQSSTFLPSSMDSDSIADTIKSFFPVASASSSSMEFQTFPTHDLLSRNNANNNPNNQDLRLSLHSFQDPTLLRPQVLLSGTPLGFDSWSEQQQQHHHPSELSRFQRLPTWNSTGEASAAGYMFNLPPVLGQNQFLSQRGPLQSSNTSSIRAWMDPPPSSAMPMDHSYQQQHPLVLPIYHQSSFSGGFYPSRIQGDQEEQDGYADNKPSSASSDSCH